MSSIRLSRRCRRVLRRVETLVESPLASEDCEPFKCRPALSDDGFDGDAEQLGNLLQRVAAPVGEREAGALAVGQLPQQRVRLLMA